ncbi:long-chain-fatty-acid--CoA ligase ACSBG2-like isoform X1 [Octopus vulgaris]|uniref:long-chain-fatty-acid--CoA ligase n=1 Tax=Octopus vulgaris TaxID=6645 RepID=A0AA36EZF8_OCTVU|nr:long-chain-fatty-acid--CoA ligase ACSBG2-like isoform X1 [Octopus vulgaris]
MGDTDVIVTKYTNNNGMELDAKQPAVCITERSSKPESNGVSVENGGVPISNSDEFNYEVTNQLAPAISYTAVNSCDTVNLRISDKEFCNLPPISVPYLLHSTVQKIPNTTALAVKRDNVWIKWSYKEYEEEVLCIAKAFIKLGLEPHHGVGILGFNSPEWLISNLAAIYAAGISVGIYTTNTAEACAFVAKDSNTNIMIVENHQQLQKILEVRDSLPDLKAIVVYSGEVAVKEPNIYSWQELKKMGAELPMSLVHQRLQTISPNKCCLLIYTSGTTGNPKGVMISHDNLTWTAHVVQQNTPIEFGNEFILSYLPLSHVAAQLLDIYMTISAGASLYFAQPDALKSSLAVTLREVRPTFFLGVPRVWEKIVERIKTVGHESSNLTKKIATWAKSVGLKGNYSRMNGETKSLSCGCSSRRTSKPLLWPVANVLVFKKVRSTLGLDRCKMCLTAAAPIMKETLDFMMSLNIPVLEIYGMSESTGPHTISVPKKFKVGSVGCDLCGVQTLLHSVDGDGNGEVCMNGRHVFMGYLKTPEKTNEAIDEDGWLHSGDIGKKDKDFLYITGRIKEIIITAGGENIAPCPIEEAVKEELPIVSQCMVVGDKRKFLSMLITLKVDINPDTLEPTDKLTTLAASWCRSIGSNTTAVSEIVNNKDENVMKAIQNAIDKANLKAVSRAAKVQKWSILLKDFSIPGGELGPTMKVRRPIVHKMYSTLIDSFY